MKHTSAHSLEPFLQNYVWPAIVMHEIYLFLKYVLLNSMFVWIDQGLPDVLLVNVYLYRSAEILASILSTGSKLLFNAQDLVVLCQSLRPARSTSFDLKYHNAIKYVWELLYPKINKHLLMFSYFLRLCWAFPKKSVVVTDVRFQCVLLD